MPYALRVALTMLVGTALLVGLPFVGWGLDDWRGFLADPVRASYVALALLLNLVISLRMPAVGKPRERAQRVVSRQRWAVPLLQIASLALVLAGPYGDRRDFCALPQGEAWRWAGLALYTGGLVLMHWTQSHLGRQFSIQVSLQENHRLVTNGPYRRLRHPRYAGIVLFSAGLALLFRSWSGLLIAAAVSAVLLWRIRDEEALLRETFAPQWEEYTRRSWRIIPFVY